MPNNSKSKPTKGKTAEPGRTAGKAEGSEKVVDKAIRNKKSEKKK